MKRYILLLILIPILISLCGCNNLIGNNLDDRLVGTWTHKDSYGLKYTYTFFSDGTCSVPVGLQQISCTYEIKDDLLSIEGAQGTVSQTFSYSFSNDETKLTLKEAGSSNSRVFTKQ
mgnify:CR=1 FL=1